MGWKGQLMHVESEWLDGPMNACENRWAGRAN